MADFFFNCSWREREIDKSVDGYILRRHFVDQWIERVRMKRSFFLENSKSGLEVIIDLGERDGEV